MARREITLPVNIAIWLALFSAMYNNFAPARTTELFLWGALCMLVFDIRDGRKDAQ